MSRINDTEIKVCGDHTLEVKESVYRTARLLEAVFASAVGEADWRITESQLRGDVEGTLFWGEVWRFLMTEEMESVNFDWQIVPDKEDARA